MDFKKLKKDTIIEADSEAATLIDAALKKPIITHNYQRLAPMTPEQRGAELMEVLAMANNFADLLRAVDGVENKLEPRELLYVAGQIDIMSAHLASFADMVTLPMPARAGGQ